MNGATARCGLAVACMTVAPLLAAGCISPNSVTCSDGRVCPAGSRCDVANHTCITEAELAACAGLAEEATCSIAGAPGKCRGGACKPFFCGDGDVVGLESCDSAPPAGQSCLDYGFDRGVLGCSNICAPAFEGCGHFGWSTVLSEQFLFFFAGIWGSGPDDVFAVGLDDTDPPNDGPIRHWDGVRWAPMKFDPSLQNVSSMFLSGVWGSGPNDVFAIGGASILHWDGDAWRSQASGTGATLTAIWGSGPDDVFAVGGGTIVHWDGSAWREVRRFIDTLAGVWGSGPDDVFVVGYNTLGGTVLHWNGIEWFPMTLDAPNGLSLLAVWGSGPDDVFAAGRRLDAGVLIHWDGTRWSTISTPPTASLSAVWGSGPEDVFVAGQGNSSGGIVLHRDASGWTVMASEPFSSPSGLWGSGPGDVFLAAFGAILHGPGTIQSTLEWSTVSQFNDVTGSDAFEDVIAVGTASTKQGAIVRWN